MTRIVIDGHFFKTPWTGVAYYAHGLLSALREDRRSSSLTVLEGLSVLPLAEWDGQSPEAHNDSVSPRLHRLIYSVPALRGMARRARALLHRVPLAGLKIDIFHALNYMPVTTVNAEILPVVHDMSCVTNPQDHPAERVRFFEAHLPRVINARAIHTVSQFSKDEIVRLLGVPGDRVRVIHPGPDKQCLSAPLVDEANPTDVPPLGLRSGRYVASISTLEPRKNLRTLVSAQLSLDRSVAQTQPLVIAGAKGWGDLRLPSGFDAAVADGRIIQAGYLDRRTLINLQRHARAVAYPSVYEGFGLPVLEALACGTQPVVTEGTACVEAGQGAASVLPGLDVDAWRDCLSGLADHKLSLHDRLAYRDAAIRAPNWEQAAEQTLDMYETILGD